MLSWSVRPSDTFYSLKLSVYLINQKNLILGVWFGVSCSFVKGFKKYLVHCTPGGSRNRYKMTVFFTKKMTAFSKSYFFNSWQIISCNMFWGALQMRNNVSEMLNLSWMSFRGWKWQKQKQKNNRLVSNLQQTNDLLEYEWDVMLMCNQV